MQLFEGVRSINNESMKNGLINFKNKGEKTMNRKFLSVILAAAMLSANGAVFAEEAEDIMLISENTAEEVNEPAAFYDKAVLEGTAKITEEKELYIIDAEENETVINIDENTIFTTADGNKIALDEIADGDTLRVVASHAMTMSLPPQTYGYVVIKAVEDVEMPIYVEVESIEKDENDNTVFYSKDGMYKVVYGEETEIAPFATRNIVNVVDIKEGSRILVYSNLMTMSIPALVPAQKIVILPELQVEEKEEVEPTKIILNGEELDAEIQNIDGAYLLPVRKVCEKAGLEVKWDDTLKAVSVGTIPMGVTFNIGENSYTKARMMPMTLSASPVIVEDSTYVPVDFFTEILGADIENKDGALNLSLTVNLD